MLYHVFPSALLPLLTTVLLLPYSSFHLPYPPFLSYSTIFQMVMGRCSTSPALCIQFLANLANILVDQTAGEVGPMRSMETLNRTMRQAIPYPANQQPPHYTFRSFQNPPMTFHSYGPAGGNMKGLNSLILHPGSYEPFLAPNTYRLYSMRFCPYAQRVVIYLAKKNIPVEVVNVNPDKPPNWYLAKIPKGQIPALEYNGLTIWESNVINEYFDDVFPASNVLPKDPYLKAHQKILLERLSSVSDSLFSFFAATTPQETAEVDQKLHEALRNAENLLTDKFFGDIMLWPFVERLEMVTLSPFSSFRYFPGQHYPKFGAYMARMRNEPEIKFGMRSLAQHKAYVDSFDAGNPNYDYGIYQKH
uniref:Glutathione-dependent dehydroascorbate reductase n=1 Tax=Pristionchus pacificus TaxID=54126 RepID=A0A8R1YNW6_PRIPA